MKNIYFTITLVFTLFLVACEKPLEDTYEELGDLENLPNTADRKFTLTDDDYETLKTNGEFFNSLDDARALLPALINDQYPNLDDGSSVVVNFNVTQGDLIENFNIKETDYSGLRSGDFENKNEDPENNPVTGFERSFTEEDIAEYLANLIQEEIAEPLDEDVYQVSFNYFDEEVTSAEKFYDVDLKEQTVFDTYESISITGDQVWEADDRFGATMSGFSSGTRFENKDYLISPEIDLTSAENAAIRIRQSLNFLDGENRNKVLISSDYTTGSNFDDATWIEIDFQTVPEGNSNTAVESELVSISNFAGETVHIAFVYDYPEGIAPRWQITNVIIQPDASDEVRYLYEENSILLEYSEVDKEWVFVEFTELTTEDYDAMGEEFGRPGRFNNFSDSTPPTDYLPNFLSLNFPFALEGEKIYIEYRFFNSGNTSNIIDLYEFKDGEWQNYREITAESIKFSKKNTVWVPDNTIRYILSSPDDYQFIGEQLETTEGFESAVDNMTNFNSFKRGFEGDNTSWTDDMITTAMNILLNKIDPDAEIDQKYELTFAVFTGTVGTEVLTFVKNGESSWEINDENE